MKLTWQQRDEIKKIIDAHCREIPWEGTEVDKYDMHEALCNFIENSLTNKPKQDDN